jgi:pimeloyl-ACP methyl ester carboxylesterase
MTKIFFIHGLTGSKNNFLNLQKHFPGSQSFDLIGSGGTDKPADLPYDPDTYLTFLETQIKEKAILLSHSKVLGFPVLGGLHPTYERAAWT